MAGQIAAFASRSRSWWCGESPRLGGMLAFRTLVLAAWVIPASATGSIWADALLRSALSGRSNSTLRLLGLPSVGLAFRRRTHALGHHRHGLGAPAYSMILLMPRSDPSTTSTRRRGGWRPRAGTVSLPSPAAPATGAHGQFVLFLIHAAESFERDSSRSPAAGSGRGHRSARCLSPYSHGPLQLRCSLGEACFSILLLAISFVRVRCFVAAGVPYTGGPAMYRKPPRAYRQPAHLCRECFPARAVLSRPGASELASLALRTQAEGVVFSARLFLVGSARLLCDGFDAVRTFVQEITTAGFRTTWVETPSSSRPRWAAGAGVPSPLAAAYARFAACVFSGRPALMMAISRVQDGVRLVF